MYGNGLVDPGNGFRKSKHTQPSHLHLINQNQWKVNPARRGQPQQPLAHAPIKIAPMCFRYNSSHIINIETREIKLLAVITQTSELFATLLRLPPTHLDTFRRVFLGLN